MDASFEPLFLDVGAGPQGRRFAVHHAPRDAAPRGLVVYVHPFAEEMNKSRRMAALASRALAARGFALLQIDLLGCGDSDGDLGDARWQRWVDDVLAACRWLASRHPAAPLTLWGLRAGCLVAADAARQIEAGCNFLFWQPSTSGRAVLQQFLRLKIAGEILGGQARGVADGLRAELAAGRPVQIAGYELGADLSQGLEAAALDPPAGTGRLDWIEVSARDGASLSPVATAASARWADAGWAVHSRIVPGPAFWQTTEIEDAPRLVDATVEALDAQVA